MNEVLKLFYLISDYLPNYQQVVFFSVGRLGVVLSCIVFPHNVGRNSCDCRLVLTMSFFYGLLNQSFACSVQCYCHFDFYEHVGLSFVVGLYLFMQKCFYVSPPRLLLHSVWQISCFYLSHCSVLRCRCCRGYMSAG